MHGKTGIVPSKGLALLFNIFWVMSCISVTSSLLIRGGEFRKLERIEAFVLLLFVKKKEKNHKEPQAVILCLLWETKPTRRWWLTETCIKSLLYIEHTYIKLITVPFCRVVKHVVHMFLISKLKHCVTLIYQDFFWGRMIDLLSYWFCCMCFIVLTGLKLKLWRLMLMN